MYTQNSIATLFQPASGCKPGDTYYFYITTNNGQNLTQLPSVISARHEDMIDAELAKGFSCVQESQGIYFCSLVTPSTYDYCDSMLVLLSTEQYGINQVLGWSAMVSIPWPDSITNPIPPVTTTPVVQPTTGAGSNVPVMPSMPSMPTGTPTANATISAPFNVQVDPQFVSGASADTLVWQSVPGAVKYNVYESDVFVHEVSEPTFTVTPDLIWGGASFTITAIDAQGIETIPSAPVDYLTALNPTSPPAGSNVAPTPPSNLIVTPEWNLDIPRNILRWQGTNTAHAYSVYRDGTKIVSGLYNLYYIDIDLKPGDNHSYTVSSDNTDLPNSLGDYIESPQSPSVSVTSLIAPPIVLTDKVHITKIVPNDDSAVVFFTPILGALDYRVYDVKNPSKVKYAGQITHQTSPGANVPSTPICIEWNGIDPSTGADLKIEAVDKLGPFQKPEIMKDMNANLALNGQGDPSNVPNIVASSDSFHVDCTAFVPSGTQVFFDNFRNSQPLVQQPCPPKADGSPFYGEPKDFAVFTNDKWEIRQYGADLTNSKLFFMDNHFMDVTYEGGGPGSSSPPHNNDATMVMMPKATSDISNGKVLHVTFEVDAHMDSRRWCEILITAAGDLLLDPAKFADNKNKCTVSSNVLRWQIENEQHTLQMYSGEQATFVQTDLLKLPNGNYPDAVSRIMWDHVSPFANGTDQDLDKRHRFDLYLSKTHYRIQETTPDGMYNMTQEGDFPTGVTLPFDNCQVYFDHQVYHTTNDRAELIEWGPYEPYWYNCRPHADERHWDNISLSVLDTFPTK